MTSRTTIRTRIRTTTTTTAISTASANTPMCPGCEDWRRSLTLWEEAIQDPIMTLTVHDMEETGFTDAVLCGGGTLASMTAASRITTWVW